MTPKNPSKNMLNVQLYYICNSVIVILECLKGRHLDLIRPKESLSKLFDKMLTNITSTSAMLKALSILHSALQEEDISQMVAHKIKEKEYLLCLY
jgi:hypothetical protein